MHTDFRERVAFFRRLPRFDYSKWLVFVGEWNENFDPNIDMSDMVLECREGVQAADRLHCPSRFDRQVSSGSPWEGDVNVAIKFALCPCQILYEQCLLGEQTQIFLRVPRSTG